MVNHNYLTHDEQLASEAAFTGKPLNPTWSQRAREVYCNLILAIKAREREKLVQVVEVK